LPTPPSAFTRVQPLHSSGLFGVTSPRTRKIRALSSPVFAQGKNGFPSETPEPPTGREKTKFDLGETLGIAHALHHPEMIDSLFSSTNYQASKQLLDAAVLKHEALASNIANVETPGYKRVDLPKDFNAQMAESIRRGNLGMAPGAKIVQDPSAVTQRKDGNNVQIEKELLAMSQNGAEYETLTEFVSGSLKQLRLAITGHNQ
jgi:flagellar basal-body rod protein FlgB